MSKIKKNIYTVAHNTPVSFRIVYQGDDFVKAKAIYDKKVEENFDYVILSCNGDILLDRKQMK